MCKHMGYVCVNTWVCMVVNTWDMYGSKHMGYVCSKHICME